jgi:hypothetical protein
MPDREFDYHPPPKDPTVFFEASGLPDNFTLREFDFHKHQIFTILDGSGDSVTTGPEKQQLAVDQTSGDGPLYDTWLIYKEPPSGDGRASGVNLIQVGDYLAIGELELHNAAPMSIIDDGRTVDMLAPDPTGAGSYYLFNKYVIRQILARPNEQSGEFRVEWLDAHGINEQNVGEHSPASGCWGEEYGENQYGGDCTDTRTVILREVNMPFFLTD